MKNVELTTEEYAKQIHVQKIRELNDLISKTKLLANASAMKALSPNTPNGEKSYHSNNEMGYRKKILDLNNKLDILISHGKKLC